MKPLFERGYSSPKDYQVMIRSRKPLTKELRELILKLEDKLETHNRLSTTELIVDALSEIPLTEHCV